jgi:RHS repeat-associated protein
VRYFYYDGDKIIAEREGSSWVVRYLLGLKPCGHVVSGQVRVYHADRLGSVRWVTDGSGNLVASYVYEGFGKIVGQEGSEVVPYRFCGLWGYRNDGDAGLLHVGARYYEVETGRWVQKDKLFQLNTLYTYNLYVYCLNNPVNDVDIVGLISWREIIFFILCLIGGEMPPDRDKVRPPIQKDPPIVGPPPKNWPPKLEFPKPKSGGFANLKLPIILLGLEACYEIITYQPGGPPTGPFTAIGDWIGKKLFPIE